MPTRALILSTYVKFINLFPEIKPQIQQVLSSDSQSRNGNQELQQRAIEYLQLTTIATPDVLVQCMWAELACCHSYMNISVYVGKCVWCAIFRIFCLTLNS